MKNVQFGQKKLQIGVTNGYISISFISKTIKNNVL